MKYIYTILICLLTTNLVKAQHEFSLYGMGGLAGLNYKPKGDGSIGGGGSFGIDYTYRFNRTWGTIIGFETSFYGSKASFTTLEGTYGATDRDNSSFLFNYGAANYDEKQNVSVFSIPIMLQYRYPLDRADFFLSGGFKLGFPMTSKTKINPGVITTSGYYGYENITYTNLPEYGFVNELPTSQKEIDLGFGFAPIFTLETGFRFLLNDNWGLYAGAYVDYGLSNMQKKTDSQPIIYQPQNPTQFGFDSMLNTSMVDKVNLVSFGIKLRLSFDLILRGSNKNLWY